MTCSKGTPIRCAYPSTWLEHIPEADEARFIRNVMHRSPQGVSSSACRRWNRGVFIAPDKAGHVNASRASAQASARAGFTTVFRVLDDDEIVPTGFYPMAHYLLGPCHPHI